jgi:16S rRNA (guanine527-N7)-methyltransferase
VTEIALEIGLRLNEKLAAAGLKCLEPAVAGRFGTYCSLLQRWNARMNLTAVRDEDGILSRHFVESIVCARALPTGIESLLDFGSGGGFPGVPIALCRPEIAITLAESQGKKAAFLREAVRTLGLSAVVQSGRAETLLTPFDCVTLRAVDRMGDAVQAALRLVAPGGLLVVMTTGAEWERLKLALGSRLQWMESQELPGSTQRVVALGRVLEIG